MTTNPPGAPEGPLLSALAQLRLKLLDLTGRNRLLNFKHSAGKSLQFVEGQPADIYKRLVEEGNKIGIIGLPEPSKRDLVIRHGRSQRPDPKEWAKAQGLPTGYDIPEKIAEEPSYNIRALMYPDDLAKHCRKIEREGLLAIEETGANMLFLVLGFLEFPNQQDSDKIFAAPLISVPVSLSKIGGAGIQSFSLTFTGEDISENLSLREKLKNDFGLILPDLGEDDIDAEGYFAEIKRVIKRQPGFALKRRVSLCLLSFTNMLLVRDLDPTKWPQHGKKNGLTGHRTVRVVLEGASSDSDAGLGIASEHPVEELPAAAIPLVYDADSSQHSALVDVLSLKKDTVIQGPPGTGKSQTITNLIAACLAEGKKVLFVAEKLAALDVVKNRLSMAGLDPFVLELHSNKSNKKRVLEEIGKRIKYTASYPRDMNRLHHQLESYREQLKAYSTLINSVSYNSFGLSLHEVIWRAEKHRKGSGNKEGLLSQIAVADAKQISEFELSKRIDCLTYLSSHYQAISGFSTESTFWGFLPKHLVPGDEVALKNIFHSSLEGAIKLRDDADSLATVLSGPITGLSIDVAQAQLEVLSCLLTDINRALPLDLIPGFFQDDRTGQKARKAITDFTEKLRRYHEAIIPVQRALVRSSSVSQSTLDSLKLLLQTAQYLGVELGNSAALESLNQELSGAVAALKPACDAISTFASGKNIAFDGSLKRLYQFTHFTDLIVSIPEEHLHLQASGLLQTMAAHTIEALMALQKEWTTLQADRNELFYLDAIPSRENIKEAILVFRQGDAWYRIFQGRWRSAVALHKSMQRRKQKIPAGERLEQLEKVMELLNLREKWKNDSAWLQVLGFPAPIDPPVLRATWLLLSGTAIFSSRPKISRQH